MRRTALLAALILATLGGGIAVAVTSGGSATTTAPPRLIVTRDRVSLVVDAHALHGEGSVAFRSRGVLWLLVGRTGKLIRLAPARDRAVGPAFSADGRWLAFTVHPRGGHAEIRLVRSGGGGVQRLHRREIAFDGWSPTGHVLAVEFERRSGSVPVRDTSSVATWRPHGSPQVVASVRGLTGVVWSPDGRRLAVASADWDQQASTTGAAEIATYPIAGGTPTVWISRAGRHGRLAGENELYLRLAGWWTGQGIGFWVFGNGQVLSPDQAPLELLASPGSVPRRLGATLAGGGQLAGGPGQGEERTVAASTFGYLAFVDETKARGFGRQIWLDKKIVVCGADRSCRRVPSPPHTVTLDPAWSADGRALAYVVAPSRASPGFPQHVVRDWYAAHRLAIYRPRTGRVTYVDGGSGASAPVWSRDGKLLLYAARDGIWSVPAAGGRARRVARPLFVPGALPVYYGQVDWVGSFAWSAG